MKNSKTSTTSNATLIRLKGTPFKSAGELKAEEILILKEEWANVERARIRRELFMKESNRAILDPLFKGLKAKFVGESGIAQDHLVKVFLGTENEIHVEIDAALAAENPPIESLVKPLVDGLLGGYLAALGLKNEGLVLPKSTAAGKRRKS